jgi:glyoxylase-like metal-dependent hydrolase (beta-lactamase superfamily II)
MLSTRTLRRKIKGIILTHGHYDHIQSAAILQKKFNCPIFAHEKEIPFILGKERIQYSGIGKILSLFDRFFRFERPGEVKPVSEIPNFVEEGKNMKIIHTPGHTPGSISILYKNQLVCGDLLRVKKGISLSPKAFCTDYREYLKSVKKVSSLRFEKIFPGHGEPAERRDFDKLIERIRNGSD